jgi:hypothetical protein
MLPGFSGRFRHHKWSAASSGKPRPVACALHLGYVATQATPSNSMSIRINNLGLMCTEIVNAFLLLFYLSVYSIAYVLLGTWLELERDGKA